MVEELGPTLNLSDEKVKLVGGHWDGRFVKKPGEDVKVLWMPVLGWGGIDTAVYRKGDDGHWRYDPDYQFGQQECDVPTVVKP